MKTLVSSVALAIIAMALNGCGSSNVPECDSKEVTDLLGKLVKQELYEKNKSYASGGGGSSAYDLGAQMGAQMATNMANQQIKEELEKADIFFDGFMTGKTNEQNRIAACPSKSHADKWRRGSKCNDNLHRAILRRQKPNLCRAFEFGLGFFCRSCGFAFLF